MNAGVLLRVFGLLTTLAVGYQVFDYSVADDVAARSLSGKVRVAGRPLRSGIVRFISTADDRFAGAGAFISNGAYSIDGETGLAPGKYQVQISGIGREEQLRMSHARRRKASDDDVKVADPIPPHYNLQSRIQVEVASDLGVVGFDFDLK